MIYDNYLQFVTWDDNIGHYVINSDKRDIFMRHLILPFKDAHPEFTRIKKKYPEFKLNLSNPKNNMFQALSLLVAYPKIAFGRADLDSFFTALSQHDGYKKSNDPIQSVNKADQVGLAITKLGTRSNRRYALSIPLKFDGSKIKIRIKHDATEEEKQQSIKRLKEYFQKTFIDELSWEAGHRDPTNPDEGIVMQPGGYQRSVRDRFKFDDWGLSKCPSLKELKEHRRKYYTDKEWEEIKKIS